MKYQKINRIEFVKKQNGYWVRVTFENGTEWLPALVDLGKILNYIGKCEDRKYPHGEGRNYTKRFITESIESKDSEEIKRIYNEYFNPNNL